MACLVLVIVLGGVVFVYVWHWIDRPITNVRIDSVFHHVSREQVQKKLLPIVSKKFFNVNKNDIYNALMSLSWIQSITIDKRWPDTVAIKIEERTAVGRWNNKNILDSHGHIFSVPSLDVFQNLPLLQGPPGLEQQAWHCFLQLKQQVKILLSSPIKEFQITPNGEQYFKIDHVKVAFGTAEIEGQMNKFKTLYVHVLKSRWHDVKHIDFRYAQGAAVSWKKHHE